MFIIVTKTIAEQKGYTAHKNNKKFKDNPFKPSDPNYWFWNCGFFKAFKEEFRVKLP